jgi:hypothetical protein
VEIVRYYDMIYNITKTQAKIKRTSSYQKLSNNKTRRSKKSI